MPNLLFLVLLVSSSLSLVSATYQKVQEYSGDTFFDGWNFFTSGDPTHGFVQFKDQASATSAGLIKTQAGSGAGAAAKQVFMGADSTNITPNGRPAVRIESKQNFNHALVLADIAHAPGGVCGTWPSFWMLGKDPWPVNGEIDILEGVNDRTKNAMTLHTNPGVAIGKTPLPDKPFTGTVQTTNCDINAPGQSANAGCTIEDASDKSYGAGFNAVGGGVYATEWTSDFIRIWFFPRDKIPADITSGSPVPNTATWGNPSAVWAGSFSIDDHFKDLHLVFDLTFCGDFAGNVFNQSPACTAKAPTCNDFVANNPKAFAHAFWLINSVKVFQDNGKKVKRGGGAVLDIQ